MGVSTLHASNIIGLAFEFAHARPVWIGPKPVHWTRTSTGLDKQIIHLCCEAEDDDKNSAKCKPTNPITQPPHKGAYQRQGRAAALNKGQVLQPKRR